MADALKRIQMSNNTAFQNRCMYFMYEQSGVVLGQETPDVDDLLLAKAIWAGTVKPNDMVRIVLTNATIGAQVDADEMLDGVANPILDSSIEYAINTEDKFHALAIAYKSAGLIGA